MICYMSEDACTNRTFRAKLRTLSVSHGKQGGLRNMKSTYPNGCNFVVMRTLVPVKHKTSFIIFVQLGQPRYHLHCHCLVYRWCTSSSTPNHYKNYESGLKR